MGSFVQVLLVILVTLLTPWNDSTSTGNSNTIALVEGRFISAVNTKSLRSVVQEIRNTFLPNFVAILNDNTILDNFSVSAQIGDCCDRGTTGAKASIALSNLRINNATLQDPILTTKSSSSSSSSSSNNNSNDIATLVFQTRDMDIQTKITSNIAVAIGLLGSASCSPTLRVFLKLPQLAFHVNFIKGSTTTGSSANNVGASSYRVNMNNATIDPVQFYITVVDDSARLCDNVLNPITLVINRVVELLTDRLTNTFRTQLTDMINTLVDTVPIAFNAPIPMSNGQFNIGLGLQALQSTNNNGILSVLGTSFSSTIQKSDDTNFYRNKYVYNRALTDTTSLTSDVNTALSLFGSNNNRFVQLRYTFPNVNNFMSAMWHQVWAGLATDPTVVSNMEDFCTLSPPPTTLTTNTTTTTLIVDPCPFPPIRSDPISILDSVFLRVFFFGNNNFKYQTVIEPPMMNILPGSITNSTSKVSDLVLQGRVPGKIVLRGTRTTGFGILASLFGRKSSSERTIAALGVDFVVDLNLPAYNVTTGIIQWEDDGVRVRIENAVSDTRFQFLGTTLTNAAVRFVNQFIEGQLLQPLNRGIRFGLQQIPIKIPSLKNLPLRNTKIDFTFPNFDLNFQEYGMNVVSDFKLNVTYPPSVLKTAVLILENNNTTSSSSSNSKEDDIAVDVTTLITTFAQEDVFVNATASTDTTTTVILFTNIYDSGNDGTEEIAITSRVTSDTSASSSSTVHSDSMITIEQSVNGQWVPI
jgi:hypothetical protein